MGTCEGLIGKNWQCAGTIELRHFDRDITGGDPWPFKSHLCELCWQTWQDGHNKAVIRYQEKRDRDRQRHRESYKPVIHTEQPCARCGALYIPKRSDSRYCSGSCRAAAHRQR